MHIEIVSDTYLPDLNGAAKTLGYLKECLIEQGVSVQVICPQDQGDLLVPSRSLPYYPALKGAAVRPSTLRKRWQEKRPDAVYIAVESLLGFVALRVARKMNIPVLAGYHTNFPQYFIEYHQPFLSKVIFKYLRWFHSRATSTWVPSESVKDELEAIGYNQLKVMGRGVDSALFHPSRRSEALRKIWGCQPDTPVAIFAGRVSLEKNLTLLSQSFKAMREIRPDLVCLVAGDGPSFKRFKKENPEVMCLGFLKGEKLAEVYASSDILVFPSKTETFGNTVTEAMASGLITVSYNYAASAMHIKDEVNGLLVDFKDPDGAAFLKRAVDSLQYCDNSEMRQNATESMKGVSWQNVSQGVIDAVKGYQAES